MTIAVLIAIAVIIGGFVIATRDSPTAENKGSNAAGGCMLVALGILALLVCGIIAII